MGRIITCEFELDYEITEKDYEKGLNDLLVSFKNQLSDYILSFEETNVTALDDGSYLLGTFMGLNPKRFPEFHKSYNNAEDSYKLKISGQVIPELNEDNPYFVPFNIFWFENRAILSIEDTLTWPYNIKENKWGDAKKVNLQAIVFIKMILAKAGASFAKYGPLDEETALYDYYIYVYGDTPSVLFSIMEQNFTEDFIKNQLRKYQGPEEFEIKTKEKILDADLEPVLEDIKSDVVSLTKVKQTITAIQFAKALGEEGARKRFNDASKKLIEKFID